MKSALTALLDLTLRYVLLMLLLLGGLGLVFGLQALGTSENLAGAVAIVFMVGGALTVVIYSRRKAAERDAAPSVR